jgi:hypothetical protein
MLVQRRREQRGTPADAAPEAGFRAEEFEQLAACQPSADDRLDGNIDAVNPKDRLGEIKTSAGNIYGGPPGRMGGPIIAQRRVSAGGEGPAIKLALCRPTLARGIRPGVVASTR